MARKCKIGLTYFSHDCDSTADPKLKILLAKYGVIGYGTYWKILEEGYKEKGYYFDCTEDNIILLSSDLKLDVEKVQEIINFMIEKKLFNKEIYEKYSVLTSKRMQRNYIAGSEQRKKIEVNSKHLLIDIKNEMSKKSTFEIHYTDLNRIETVVNDLKTVEKDTKYSKVNSKEKNSKSKVVKESNINTTTTPDFIISFFTEKGFNNNLEATKFYEYNKDKKLNEKTFKTLATRWIEKITEKDKINDGYSTPEIEIISQVEKVFDNNIENFIKSIHHFKIPGTDKFNEEEFYGNFRMKLNGLSTNLKAVKLLETLIAKKLKEL